MTVDCPFDCEYLREARRHEKPPELGPDDVPHADIRVSDEFLRDNEPLVVHLGQLLLQAAVEAQGAVDSDVREALESMIKTLMTAESGLIYETRPSNPYAASVQVRVQAGIEQLRKQLSEQSGVNTIRDKDVLGVLVFLQRLALHNNNGRRRCRAFLDFLYVTFPPPPPAEEPSGIITP